MGLLHQDVVPKRGHLIAELRWRDNTPYSQLRRRETEGPLILVLDGTKARISLHRESDENGWRLTCHELGFDSRYMHESITTAASMARTALETALQERLVDIMHDLKALNGREHK